MKRLGRGNFNNIRLSDEQLEFIEKAKAGKNILVDACIGSGKTTAIQQLCNKLPADVGILYLTYNKLLKLDAKSKIKNANATVTNYHGFAFTVLEKAGIRAGIPDLIQCLVREKPPVGHYDVLIIDEYQDIEQELAEMLEYIKSENPKIQIIAVGDMEQKIYDKTTLNVPEFIERFLGPHERLEFTRCFRLPRDFAAKLGRIWQKKIVGVNSNCSIEEMRVDEVIRFLSAQKPQDILCLGSRSGDMANTLNVLENEYPETFNKNTVYASISERDAGATHPRPTSAIFTTFDSSKGLERKICVVFDYTESYWQTRISKPQQAYEILRNIFCVAASRGKNKIIFVKNDEAALSEKTLSTRTGPNVRFTDVDISEMFDFKYKEDVEQCFRLLSVKSLTSPWELREIRVSNKDGLIDLSPCIGIYQEAMFFNGYDIDRSIDLWLSLNESKKFLYGNKERNLPLDKKILILVSLETKQNRYRTQVNTPFVNERECRQIFQRLSTVFDVDERVQQRCCIDFAGIKGGSTFFSARGFADVVKSGTVYELKFVSELAHEHFLQCATYMVALGLERGILWNTRNNERYEITVPDKAAYLDAVTRAVTKGCIDKYYKPAE